MPPDDTRDKVVALEVELRHLSAQVNEMSDKVAEMHDVLMQARGVRWIIVLMAGVGGFVASKLGAFIPWPK